MMRLVFVLCAEERRLLKPSSSLDLGSVRQQDSSDLGLTTRDSDVQGLVARSEVIPELLFRPVPELRG